MTDKTEEKDGRDKFVEALTRRGRDITEAQEVGDEEAEIEEVVELAEAVEEPVEEEVVEEPVEETVEDTEGEETTEAEQPSSRTPMQTASKLGRILREKPPKVRRYIPNLTKY